MIERYSLSPLKEIWEDTTKFSIWLRIELYVCEALSKEGVVPQDDLKAIKEKATFDVSRVREIEKETHHDVIAFLTNIAENVGRPSRYIHLGLTSSDLLDTTLALQMKEAGGIILERIDLVIGRLARMAMQEKRTPMIGRTHGVHAEPITLGLKFASWYDEMKRLKDHFRLAVEEISCGKLSGAVGTFAHLDPGVESYVMNRLGLRPASISSQIISRDRHAFYLCAIAMIGSGLEKFATEIRNLHRTEIGELEEPFRSGQKGSSAMPHKRNPILCERVAGLSRVLRANSFAAMENINLWHERDITHSSVERVIIPDSTILVYYMLTIFQQVLEGLIVHRERMDKNLHMTGGMIFSQGLLLKLVQKGLTREEAYSIIQSIALSEERSGRTFRERALASKKLRRHLSEDEIAGSFDVGYHLRNVDRIFERLGLQSGKGGRTP